MKFSLNKLAEISQYGKILEKRVSESKRLYAKTIWEQLYLDTPRNTRCCCCFVEYFN
jgi:hypothetical protein